MRKCLRSDALDKYLDTLRNMQVVPVLNENSLKYFTFVTTMGIQVSPIGVKDIPEEKLIDIHLVVNSYNKMATSMDFLYKRLKKDGLDDRALLTLLGEPHVGDPISFSDELLEEIKTNLLFIKSYQVRCLL